MIKQIKKWLFKNDVFQKTIKGHWYCGSWYMYLSDQPGYEGKLDPDTPICATDKVAFNHFRTGHGSSRTSGLIDGLIPAIRIGDRIGLYKQVGGKYHTTSFYDGAPWDDGYHIDMKFVKSIKVTNDAA